MQILTNALSVQLKSNILIEPQQCYFKIHFSAKAWLVPFPTK